MQAVSAQDRDVLPPGNPTRPSLPRTHRRTIVRAIGVVVGMLLWVLYLRLMIHSTNVLLHVGFGLVGGACGLALVTIPVLMWDFLRKQGYQILLRQWTDRSRVLAHAARKELRDEDHPQDALADNDMAVVDFLQANYTGAVEGFEQAHAAGAAEASVNLLAALAEAGQWDRLSEHLQRDLLLEDLPAEANLARLGARVPDEELLQRLWDLAQERRHPLLLNNLGARALQRGQYPQAERALQLAAGTRPGYAYAHANLGVLSYRQGHLARAIAEAASAAGLVEDETIFANLGTLLAMSGDWRGAEHWLEKAHKLQPRDFAVLLNLGSVRSQIGKQEEALAALHAAQSQAAYTAVAEYNLGLHYHRDHNLVEAMEHLSQAAELAPNDPDVLNNIGCVYFGQGKYQDANACFVRVEELSPGGLYQRNIMRAELAAGRYAEAEALIKASEEDEGLSLERGLVYLLRALAIPAETKTHQQMAEFNLNAAAAEFTKAMASGRATANEAALNYGLSQYLRGEHLAAADTFAQTLRKGSAHQEMYYLTGICYVMAGLREREQHEMTDDTLPGPVRELFLKARPYLEKAVEVAAVVEAATYDLGLLNYLIGDYQRAADVLRKIARHDSPAHVLNAMALAQAKLAQDLQFTAQTATLMPEARKKEIRTQARQLLAAALHYFTQALHMEPEAPMTHANMGLALMLRNQKGDVEAALQHWQLMHQHGGALARKTYEEFMQAMSAEAARRLRFQDVELSFRPVDVRSWVQFPPPKMSDFKYVVRELLDEPEWQFQASHTLVRKALAYRLKAERVRRKLKRLAI